MCRDGSRGQSKHSVKRPDMPAHGAISVRAITILLSYAVAGRGKG
jgi:hypothetical protein